VSPAAYALAADLVVPVAAAALLGLSVCTRVLVTRAHEAHRRGVARVRGDA